MKLQGMIIKNSETGKFTAQIRQLTGLIAEGDTKEEAQTNLINLFKDWAKTMSQRGEPIEFSEEHEHEVDLRNKDQE